MKNENSTIWWLDFKLLMLVFHMMIANVSFVAQRLISVIIVVILKVRHWGT